jgi:hypothetical protein
MVEGNAQLQADVRAPRGTRARMMRYEGLFKSATMRHTQSMAEAEDWEGAP